ncbi:MAG: ADP-ribosylglycohydrolase family protein [archaeon]|nr:ADP-ribosylglycohydrolase family protein [archaeon]
MGSKHASDSEKEEEKRPDTPMPEYTQINHSADFDKVEAECRGKEDNSFYPNLMEYIFTSKIDDLYKRLDEYIPNQNKSDMIKRFKKNISVLEWKINHETDSEKRACFASIFGSFLGDAMGAYCEFTQPSSSNYKKIYSGKGIFGGSKGTVTDDSEMAMSLAYGIMCNPKINEISPIYSYFFYGCWSKSDPADIGNATSTALSKFDFCDANPKFMKEDEIKGILRRIKRSNEDSKANGFLMRIAPFYSWFYFRNTEEIKTLFSDANNINKDKLKELYLKAKTEAAKDNAVTHPNTELPSVSAVCTLMAVGAIKGLTSEQIIKVLNVLLSLDFEEEEDKTVMKEVKKHLEIFSKFKIGDAFKHFSKGEYGVFDKMGYYLHAFKLTLYYVLKFKDYKEKHKNTYRKIMEEVNNFGGDTDTNGAIIGGVIGPLVKMEGLGKEYYDMIEKVNEKRIAFSPALMYLYVTYLKKTRDLGAEWTERKYIALRMFLSCFYEEGFVSLDLLKLWE